jgi:hypothetical protein
VYLVCGNGNEVTVGVIKETGCMCKMNEKQEIKTRKGAVSTTLENIFCNEPFSF